MARNTCPGRKSCWRLVNAGAPTARSPAGTCGAPLSAPDTGSPTKFGHANLVSVQRRGESPEQFLHSGSFQGNANAASAQTNGTGPKLRTLVSRCSLSHQQNHRCKSQSQYTRLIGYGDVVQAFKFHAQRIVLGRILD